MVPSLAVGQTFSGIMVRGFAYNGANQMLSSVSSKGTETAYSFDPGGSQTTKTEVTEDETKVTTYAYDFNSKLTEVALPSGKKVSYGYDGLGNRTTRTLARPDGKTEATEYLNDLSNPLVQVLQATGDKEVLTYLYGLQRISVTSERPEKNNPKPDTDYYLYDGLGSVKALVDSHGNQVARYSYDEWGVPEPGSNFRRAGHPNTYGFTGEDWDPDTEMLYLRARYYEPEIGRFGSQDLLSGNRWLPATQNRFAYAINNPTSFVDRTGLGPEVSGGMSGPLFSAAWTTVDPTAMVVLETAISGGVAARGGDIGVGVDVVSRTIDISVLGNEYRIGAFGQFSVTAEPGPWTVTGLGFNPGTWVSTLDVTVLRRTSYVADDSLNIYYDTQVTLRVSRPGPYTSYAVASAAAGTAIVAAAVYLGPAAAAAISSAASRFLPTLVPEGA